MDTSKLVKKLKKYLDLPKDKQQQKHEKFLKIVRKLQKKKSHIEIELAEQSKIDETSERYRELSQELKTVSRLIRKAKTHDLAD